MMAITLLFAAAAAATAAPSRSPNPPTTQPTQSGQPRPSLAERDRWDGWQRAAARRSGLDWLLAKAVRLKESFDDPRYVSTTGAVGLMQLMPVGGGQRQYLSINYQNFRRARRATGRRYGGRTSRQWGLRYQAELLAFARRLTEPELVRRDVRFDPRWNIEHGTAHLARDHARFRRRYPRAKPAQLLRMTLAAYYAGPGRVAFRAGRVEIPSYTRAYVVDVLGVYRRLRAGLPGR